MKTIYFLMFITFLGCSASKDQSWYQKVRLVEDSIVTFETVRDNWEDMRHTVVSIPNESEIWPGFPAPKLALFRIDYGDYGMILAVDSMALDKYERRIQEFETTPLLFPIWHKGSEARGIFGWQRPGAKISPAPNGVPDTIHSSPSGANRIIEFDLSLTENQIGPGSRIYTGYRDTSYFDFDVTLTDTLAPEIILTDTGWYYLDRWKRAY